jgi:hypothetical protein
MNSYSALPPVTTRRQFSRVQLQAAAELERRRRAGGLIPLWQPNPDRDGLPNPQRLALESPADVLGYGGSGGGGKTDLLLGLAGTQHKKAIVFRRVFKNLRGIIERSRELFSRGLDHRTDSFNEQLHRWNLGNGKQIEFEAMQYEKDKENFRGRPHDFYGFDEVTEFSRTQVEFVMAWMRSTEPGQRCRAILTFNPPSDESGNWVIDYFLPWIAFLFPHEYDHPNPAAPGELRWYATIDGKETECKDGEPFYHSDELIRPMSRTFIPAKLADNPHLANTGYSAVLQSLPEPLRSQMLYGDFAAHKEADPWQVIPTAWVKEAQRRWMEREKPTMPLSGLGADIARGGKDALVTAKRYGTWFDIPAKTPGVNVEDGPAAAALIQQALAEDEHIGYINLDVIGVGTSAYDSAKAIWPGLVNPVNAAAGSKFVVKTKEGKEVLRMKNIRAEYHWRLRMALDPVHGDNIALPPGNEIVADLCAAKYKMLAGGVIQIEEKTAIKERIGRSPDLGEAVMLANLDIGRMASISDLPQDTREQQSRWSIEERREDSRSSPSTNSGRSRWKL